MNDNLEVKNNNINNNAEDINVNSNIKNYSKQKVSSNQKKKRNKKNKNEKSKSFNNINIGGGILSEIKQISIPPILEEKENLFKILQSEIVNIDKGIVLLNKKKKYYDEIIQKLGDEIQKEKKDIKINENKNQEYLYMENLLKDISVNEYFENNLLDDDNSFYNKIKSINDSLDYNYFLLNQKNNKNFLLINFYEEKNLDKINNKMEPNYQMTYEEFNNIEDMDNNYCILMNNEMNKAKDNNNNINKKEENNDEEKIIIDSESEQKNDNLNLIDNTPIKVNQSEEREEFTVINEVPAEEESTNNKRKKSNSENEIDKNINKEYSNSSEELDFYLLKNSNKIGKKKKNNLDEEIKKKYKVQYMGNDFVPPESQSLNLDNSKEEKIKPKKKKKNKKNKKESESEINLNNSQNDLDNSKEKSEDKSDENKKEEVNEDNNNNDKKNKKKGRKKRKKDVQISFSINEEYPDPENLDNTALSLEMKKYGMKPQNKKKNIEILKSVYNFLKIKEMPENILKKLTSFDCENNNNEESENDNENLEGSKSENILAMDELNDDIKRKIIETIKDNKIIYEKILLFKEISIKEIKSLLNSKGIIVPNKSLSQLLINSGVVLPGGWNNKK